MYVSQTNSTNTLLAEMKHRQPLCDGFTVYTYYQTAGRGQKGNSWESERGQNLLFSTLILPKGLPVNQQFILSQIISLAIKNVLSNYTDNIRIKWPNDIYWNDRKIAGILIENELIGSEIKNTIAGVGLNVNQSRFVSDAPNPVSLAQITGKKHNKRRLLDEILHEIYALRQLIGQPDVIRHKYFDALYRATGFYTYKTNTGEILEARITNVQPNGILELENREGQKQAFYFKEVAFVLA